VSGGPAARAARGILPAQRLAEAAASRKEVHVGEILSWDAVAVLVRRARRGDEEAFRRLLESQRATISSTLAACGVRSRDTAFDLAQDVALKVWSALPELRDPRALGAWLRRITANVARDHLRKLAARPEESIEQAAGLAADDDPQADAARGDELRLMLAALGGEESPVVELLVASAEGTPVAELSRRAGTSEAALKMRLSRARERLRRRLAALRAEVRT
jgi:RNA polymerase sigma-70 factor (ECF subfamily)